MKNRKVITASEATPGFSKHLSQMKNPGMIAAVILLLFCFAHAIWCFSIGWNNTLNEHHSFRQSQNAIMAFYIKNQPFNLAFELPVLGKPWAVPTEFPLYDILTANFSKYFLFPLDQSGRLVSAALFILTLIPIYSIFRFRNVGLQNTIIIISIFLISPFYLFWSRTFMPESTALFFSCSYLACVMWGGRKKSWGLIYFAMFFGILAGLSKVTTWLPFFGISGLWLIRDYLHLKIPLTNTKDFLSIFSRLMIACGIPFFVALCWIKYSDNVKMLNPLAVNISSTSPGMKAWNYGTLAQKLSLNVWETILSRVFTLFGLPEQAWLILLCGIISVVLTKRYRKEVTVLVGLFVISPVFFTNLYFVHDYYMNANGIFLIAAVGFSLIALLESNNIGSKIAGYSLVVFIIFSGLCGYSQIYRPMQEMPNSEILQLTDYIKKNTPENSILIVLGADWNPIVPYYSQRKSLMIPDWPELTEKQVQAALINLKGEKIGALLVCDPHRYPLDELISQAKSIGLDFPIMRCDSIPLH